MLKLTKKGKIFLKDAKTINEFHNIQKNKERK